MIKAINLSDISRYRSELMGLAMILSCCSMCGCPRAI